MANILLNPLLWEDSSGNSPPSYWNGSAYEFISDGAGEFQEIDTVNPVVNTGDIVSFNLQVKTAATGPTINAYLAVNGTQIFTQSVNATGTYTFTSNALSSGDDVIFSLGTPGHVYNADILLTPTADPVPPIPPCGELGRVTRSFVSGYTAARTETRRIRRFSKRCCVADFNGAMPVGRTITSVSFETTSPWSLFMSNPRVESSGRTVAVDVSFNFAGFGGLLITANWDNGETTNVEFGFQVLDQPLYPSAQYPSSNGPYILTATA